MTQANQPPARDARGEPTTVGEYNGFEVYPMPVFIRLAVKDVAQVQRWYEEALGFRTMFSMPPGGGPLQLVHLRRHKYQDILLVPSAGEDGGPGFGLTITFQADGEVDAIAERAASVTTVGRSSVGKPADTPWHTYDLQVTDPSGHVLVFTSRPAHPDPQMYARWQAEFDKGRKA